MPAAADGEILVRTAYASVCGSDLHAVFGRGPAQPAAPGYPGHESVAEVVESRCPGFEPGDYVLTVPFAVDGRCLAEFQALPGAACVRLPSTAPLSHLLMAQQLGTVIYALRYHPLNVVGKDAAVIGQGSAGAFFTFMLKRAGAARVLVSDKSTARLAYSSTGGTICAPLWAQFMRYALRNTKPHAFKEPSNVTTATINRRTGMLTNPLDREGITETFQRGHEPPTKETAAPKKHDVQPTEEQMEAPRPVTVVAPKQQDNTVQMTPVEPPRPVIRPRPQPRRTTPPMELIVQPQTTDETLLEAAPEIPPEHP